MHVTDVSGPALLMSISFLIAPVAALWGIDMEVETPTEIFCT